MRRLIGSSRARQLQRGWHSRWNRSRFFSHGSTRNTRHFRIMYAYISYFLSKIVNNSIPIDLPVRCIAQKLTNVRLLVKFLLAGERTHFAKSRWIHRRVYEHHHSYAPKHLTASSGTNLGLKQMAETLDAGEQ
ncbi:uncharacterized protein LOC135715128 [Ochlerotatus camptorhynchus]|uniref:uncharacterized protein LOC135715128 n=1 Tax=Ochlerotatus camptorhynchus TaxID=644619 RepID=UPI0031E2D6D6